MENTCRYSMDLLGSDSSCIAEDGQISLIDNESFFSTGRPLAISTAAREKKPKNNLVDPTKGGSFLDISGQSVDTPQQSTDQQQLKLSFSAINQTGDRPLPPADVKGSRSAPNLPVADDFGFNNMESWEGMQQLQKLQNYDGLSRNSSLGLIQVDAMSDLSSSVFHLNPSPEEANNLKEKQQISKLDNASASYGSRGSSKTSLSDTHNFLKPDIVTIKKKPTAPAPIPSGEVRQSLVFTGMGGENEGDVTIPEVEFMEEELNKLDTDFGDLEELDGSESEDEETEKNQEEEDDSSKLDMKYFVKTTGAEVKGERSAERFPSLSKVTLFDGKKAPVTDAESFEEQRSNVEMDSRQSSVMHRNSSGGRHSDTSHRDMYTARSARPEENSSSEIDTDDELEMARKAIGQEEENLMSSRPGTEGDSVKESQDDTNVKLSLAMRQSAEGDAVTSPVLGGGGGDGSSGSDSEDKNQRNHSQAQDFIEQFRQSFKPVQNPSYDRHDMEEQRVRPIGDDLLTEKGANRYSTYQGPEPGSETSTIDTRFLTRTSPKPSSEITYASQLGLGYDDSTFLPDDVLKAFQDKEQQPGASINSQASEPKRRSSPNPPSEMTYASQYGQGFEDSNFQTEEFSIGGKEQLHSEQRSQMDDNPFGMVESSFGSFGEPEGQERDDQAAPVVYKDENGEFVTDLAFQAPFSDDQVKEQELLGFSDQEFKSSGTKILQLDQDEKEFEAENVFREDEIFPAEPVSKNNPEDSTWSYQSKMSMSCPSSLQGIEDDYTRISIGTFMKSRSGALGSLDGNQNTARPEFGMSFKTPPRNRRPVALYSTSSIGNEDETTVIEDKTEGNSTLTAQDGVDASVESNQSTNKSADVVSFSDISHFLATMTPSAAPEQIARGIMTLPTKKEKRHTDTVNSNKREETEGGAQTRPKSTSSQSRGSKLPVRIGSSLEFKRRSNSSSRNLQSEGDLKVEDLTLSSSIDSEKSDMGKNDVFHKSKPDGEESDDEKTQSRKNPVCDVVKSDKSVNDGMSQRFNSTSRPEREQSMNALSSEHYQSRGQEPADGEASGSDLYVKTSLSNIFPVQSLLSPSTSNRMTSSQGSSRGVSVSREAPSGVPSEKSPVSSTNSLGLTGHHIPDGTEYSFQTDIVHHGRNDIGSREDLVGTADIQMADSRGFDVIKSQMVAKNQKQASDNVHRPRNHVSRSQESDHSSRHVDIPVDSFVQPEHQDSETANLFQKLQGDQNSHVESIGNVHSGKNNVPEVPTQDHQQNNFFKSSAKIPSPPAQFVSTDSPRLSQYELDTIAMPPPSQTPQVLSSFRHDHSLLKQSSSANNKPLLLTSDSLTNSAFAKEYLVRDAPGNLVTKPTVPHRLDPESGHLDAQKGGIDQTRLGEISKIGDQSNMNFKSSNYNNYGRTDSTFFGNHPKNPEMERLNIPDKKVFAKQENFPGYMVPNPIYQSTPAVRGERFQSLMPHESSTLNMQSMIADPSVTVDHTSCCNGDQEQVNRQSGMSSAMDKLGPVEAPEILCFEDVCCVGISTRGFLPLRNTTGMWLECNLEITEMTLDGQQVANDVPFPFEMRPKIVIGSNATEELAVIFIPKLPGVYVAKLCIYSTLFVTNKDKEIRRTLTKITIQAIAEKPLIQVVTERHRSVDFGHVSWGCCREMSMCIVNEGRAMVPIRLAIQSSNCPWHCFTFDQRNSPADISVISRTSRPQTNALGKTVITMCLPGCNKEPKEIRIYCRPPEKHCDRAMALRPPEEVTARVDIEVDTPSSHLPPLFTVKLGAVIGVQKLHIPREVECVQLKAALGQRVQEKVVLKNAGNINIELLLSVVDFEMYFTVTPRRLVIPAGTSTEVAVSFLPIETSIPDFKTVMLMQIMPDGTTYELMVTGQLTRNARKTISNPSLQSDRHFVSFGGVAIGSFSQQKVTILNKSDQPYTVRIEARSATQEFQLQRSLPFKDVLLHPQETHPIPVSYHPSTKASAAGKLVIKMFESSVKYSIPLAGYGGTSNLELDGAMVMCEKKYMLEMGSIITGERLTSRVVLRNTGDRPAYVRAVYCADSRCKQELVDSHIIIEPNEFVLPEQSTKNIVIVLTPSYRESALCADRKDIVGVVAFFYGDEISRLKLRRVLKTPESAKFKLSNEPLLRNMNFWKHYQNEDMVDEEIPDTAAVGAQLDVNLFYSSMSQLSLSLVGLPVPDIKDSVMGTPSVHKNFTLPVRDRNPSHSSAVVPLPHTSPGILGIELNKADKEEWMIKPEHIILHAPLKKDEKPQVSKFQIINFTNRSLMYDICSPGYWIKLSPEGGTVQPKSSATFCMSVSARVTQNLHNLPWSGSVHVMCDQKYQILRVQIRSDIVLESSSSLVTNKSLVPLYCQPETDKDEKEQLGLHVSTKSIEFDATKIGEYSDTYVDLTNYSKEPIKFVISSFAPPYVKGANESKEVFRATYKVFDFTQKYGTVPPMKATQIHAKFMPRSNGTFLQHWDIQAKGAQSTTARILLTGDGLQEEKVSVQGVPKEKSHRQKSTLPVTFKDSIDSVKFSTSGPATTQIVKLALKNQSDIAHVVEAVSPKPPFSVRHSQFSIKMKNYLRLPIEFTPQSPGTYEGLLVLRVDLGYSISIKLEGTCV